MCVDTGGFDKIIQFVSKENIENISSLDSSTNSHVLQSIHVKDATSPSSGQNVGKSSDKEKKDEDGHSLHNFSSIGTNFYS